MRGHTKKTHQWFCLHKKTYRIPIRKLAEIHRFHIQLKACLTARCFLGNQRLLERFFFVLVPHHVIDCKFDNQQVLCGAISSIFFRNLIGISNYSYWFKKGEGRQFFCFCKSTFYTSKAQCCFHFICWGIVEVKFSVDNFLFSVGKRNICKYHFLFLIVCVVFLKLIRFDKNFKNR